METLRKRGRPKGGTNLVFITIEQLESVLSKKAQIPISVKFAKSIGFTGEEKKVVATQQNPNIQVLEDF